MSVKRIFGPVPSRRLGRSIGINNIPPKICSYSCNYCQLGFSIKMSATPRKYYSPEELAEEARFRTAEILESGDTLDYLTIVPDGEPTLDINIGKLLQLLKPIGIKTAVITNSSMLHLPNVRDALSFADWVSVKVDSVDELTWRKIDKPVRSLDFKTHQQGITAFAESYNGKLVTETMLVKGINDNDKILEENAAFIKSITPSASYLSIPTRPPADSTVKSPDEKSINKAFQIYNSYGLNAEYLIGYEGNEFSSTGNIEEDILSITSVHPMREDAVKAILNKTGDSFSVINTMLDQKLIVCTEYNNQRFYMRRLRT